MFLGLLWLCVMLHYAWPNECPGGEQRLSKPLPPLRKRSRDPKPFPGLTRKPPCAACEQAHAYALQPVWPKNPNVPFSLHLWVSPPGSLLLISSLQRLIVCGYPEP